MSWLSDTHRISMDELDKTRLVKKYRMCTILLALMGMGLSYYSVYVGQSRTNNPDYRALCDITQRITCSNVFLTKYGKGFGLVEQFVKDGQDSSLNQSNGVYGFAFYFLFFLLALSDRKNISRMRYFLVVAANLSSIYLGYILFIVLGDICLVCISTYLINFLLLLIIRRHHKIIVSKDDDDITFTNGAIKKKV